MRYELATPLLLGNILRWAAPERVPRSSMSPLKAPAQCPLPSAKSVDKTSVQVLTDAGANLPFNVRDRAVQFFAGEPARVRVIAGNSERVLLAHPA